MVPKEDALLRTLRQKETRTAAHNLHEGRRLELTLEQLDHAWRRREQLMDSELRGLQRSVSLGENTVIRRGYQFGDAPGRPRERAAPAARRELLAGVGDARPWSERREADSSHQPSRNLTISSSCQFDPSGGAGRCPHFPCGYRPSTAQYNHLGLPELLPGSDQTVGLTCKALLSARLHQASSGRRAHATGARITLPPLSSGSRRRLVEEVETTSVRRPLRSPRNSLPDRERALRMYSQGRRDKLEKPVDWNVNYGNKFSLRRHIKAARPPKYV